MVKKNPNRKYLKSKAERQKAARYYGVHESHIEAYGVPKSYGK